MINWRNQSKKQEKNDPKLVIKDPTPPVQETIVPPTTQGEAPFKIAPPTQPEEIPFVDLRPTPPSNDFDYTTFLNKTLEQKPTTKPLPSLRESMAFS